MGADLSRALGKLVWPEKPRSAFTRYALAVLLPVFAVLISHWLFSLSRAPFFPLFTVSVIVAAGYGGWKPGVLCTLVSTFLTALALPPQFSVRIADEENLVRLLSFLVVGVGISTAVSVVAELQRKIDSERERYRVTLTSIGDAVIATDSNGLITFMNPVAESATGWTVDEAYGRSLEDVFCIVNETTRERVDNPIHKVFELGRIVGLANHTILVRRDGSEIPIDDSAAPIHDSRGRVVGAVLVFRDITEQKLKDAALVRSEKLASVGRLAATVAHEINNPLEAVCNLVYLIKTTDDSHAFERYVACAEHELSRMSEITKQMLSFAKRESTSEVVDVAEVAESVLALYSNRLESRSISVHKTYCPEVFAYGTKSEVRQVLGNLIGNAIDALAPNGALHIRIRNCKVDGCSAARIVVADNGHGISQVDMPKLFEAFFTTKKDVGTGLGLWVTKQIVDARNGKIQVKSSVGSGTVVSIAWPALQRSVTQENGVEASVN